MAEIVGGVATFAVGILALVQWLLSRRADERHRNGERRARDQQRDIAMTQWGWDVIDLMAELETACAPLAEETEYNRKSVEVLGHRASALVDKGRLFFPNVHSDNDAPTDEGIRVKILDEVLRACYAARHVVVHGHEDGLLLRGQIWQARRRFVLLLQKEMTDALRKVGVDSVGDHVPVDPREWLQPTRELRLPVHV